jgi:hypothetical protein
MDNLIEKADFLHFLVAAKRATYASASDSARVQPLLPGSFQFEYSQGNWLYRDMYFGAGYFAGQEVVYWQEHPLWSMVYAGGLLEERPSQLPAIQINEFLKAALREVSVELPYRGPGSFRNGDFAYRNEFMGNVERFTGVERIYYFGTPIYELMYNGGLVADEVKLNDAGIG